MSKNKRTSPWKPEANDVIIALIGPTGAGKSTFINFIAGKEVATVGHDLVSCTTDLQPVVIDSLPSDFPKDRRLVLVDTPGFDNTSVDDAMILQRIGSWLEQINNDSHGNKGETKLDGIVYLHDISLTRMLPSFVKKPNAFQKICGEDALKRVVFCTTKWLDIYQNDGESRTEQLKEGFWKELIDGGSTVRKFEDSQQSAWDVITSIIEEDQLGKLDACQIQEELVAWKPEANDVIIPLMGPTGAGKSTFINFIAGKEVTTVGHELKSCTSGLLPVVIDSLPSDFPKDRRLVLVDTPGFGNTFIDDAEILHRIGSWLEDMYDPRGSNGHKGETKLAGIVYLHDISLTRMLGSTRKNLDVFQKLCGEDALNRVVLCTTMWSDIYKEDGDRRTVQLQESYWKEMIDDGATVCKFEDSQKSAWDAITSITKSVIEEDQIGKMDALQIQQELVEAKKLIPDTEAGRQLRYSLDQLLKSLKQASSKDPSRRKELDVQIAAIRDQMRVMSVPVTQRIWGLLNLRVDKILDKFMLMNATTPAPSTGNKPLVPAVGARLESDVKELIMLLGETETLYETLLKLSSDDITIFGGDEHATTEVRCWSVKRKDLKPLFVVAAPSFDSLQSGKPAIFEKVRTWLGRSCREDMRFGIIYLLSRPSSFEHLHAWRAFQSVEQSGLKSNTLFATFASEVTDPVKYDFNGSVASFPETTSHTPEMFDIALSKPVSLDLLLEQLQTMSKGPFNVIMLPGETETLYKTLLKTLPAAEITIFGSDGSDEKAITEVHCWSVRRENSQPLLLVAAPSFDYHWQAGNHAVFEKVEAWLKRLCHEDIQFGIIYLRFRDHPSSSEHLHASRALELVKQSRLKSNTLFATFANEATGAVKYGFDGNVASFQETSGHSQKMFDIALHKPVTLDFLLEELQTISKRANRKEMGFMNSLRSRISRRSTEADSRGT